MLARTMRIARLDNEVTGAGGRFQEPRARALVVALGLLSLAGWGWLVLGLDAAGRARDVWTLILVSWALLAVAVAVFAVARRARVSPVREILIFAVLFRLLALFAGLPPDARWEDPRDDVLGRAVTYDSFLLYDNDVWRYLWDGHVQARGFDPYRITPRVAADGADDGDPRLATLFEPELWWDVYDNVAFRSYTSVYPPLAQLLFRFAHALAPGSVLVLKLLLALCDVLTCFLLLRLLRLAGRPAAAVVLYAWNPLAIKEIAGSGHVDALMVTLVVLTLLLLLQGRAARGLVACALAALAKVSSLALLPLVLGRVPWRRWWLVPAVGIVVGLPYLAGLPDLLRGLAAFGRDWELNAGVWGLVRFAAGRLGAADPETVAHLLTKGLTALAVVGWTIWVWRAPAADADRRLLVAAFWVLAVPVLLNAAVMPWYVLWALPLAVVVGNRSWVLFSALVFLSYLVYVDQREELWWLLLEHGVFYLALAVELWRGSSRRRERR